MTGPGGPARPTEGRPLRVWAMATATVAFAAFVLVAPLDSDGLLKRPPAPGPTSTPRWLARAAGTVEPEVVEPPTLAATWPATPEGFGEALASVASGLEACHAAWRAGDSDAPARVVAAVRLAPRPDGTARAVDVSVEHVGGGVARMQACVRTVLSGLAFTEPPEADLVVRFALPLDAAP